MTKEEFLEKYGDWLMFPSNWEKLGIEQKIEILFEMLRDYIILKKV